MTDYELSKYETFAACVRREVGLRHGVYSRRVNAGSMSPSEAASEIWTMEGIAAYFEELVKQGRAERAPELPGLFGVRKV